MLGKEQLETWTPWIPHSYSADGPLLRDSLGCLPPSNGKGASPLCSSAGKSKTSAWKKLVDSLGFYASMDWLKMLKGKS